MPGFQAWLALLTVLPAFLLHILKVDACQVSTISAGRHSTCAVLTDGSARCWGDNTHGALGPATGTDLPGPGPALDFGLNRSVLQVAAHDFFACALLDDHSVRCWGWNGFGQLGVNDTDDHSQLVSPQLGSSSTAVQRLSTGTYSWHSCAVVTGPGVFCWGFTSGVSGTPWADDAGARINVYDLDSITPSRVELGFGSSAQLTVLDMCAGEWHNCLLTQQWGLQCWGISSAGQPGFSSITNTSHETVAQIPAVDVGTGRSATQITCGAWHTCALLDDGGVKCWGQNSHGQLGYGDTKQRGARDTDMGDNLPEVDLGSGHTVTQVSAGALFTCALLDDGSVKCWGNNYYGQLGHNCSTNFWGSQPNQMGDNLPAVYMGGLKAVSVSAGYNHVCAIVNGGRVACWGDDMYGQLALNSTMHTGCGPYQDVDLCSYFTSNPVANHTSAGASNSAARLQPSPPLSGSSSSPALPTSAPSPQAALITLPSASPGSQPSPVHTSALALHTVPLTSIIVAIIAGLLLVISM